MASSRISVIECRGTNEMTARWFYVTIGICLLWGLGLNFVLAQYAIASNYKPGSEAIALVILPFIGILITNAEHPLTSFIGYNLVAAPFGLLLGPALQQFSPGIIQHALTLTALFTAMMMLMSILWPGLFSSLGNVLSWSLLGLVIIRVIGLFVPAINSFTLFDWIGGIIFCLYIGYDMWRASAVPKNLNNAVDIALALYLDILNLFLTILKIAGKR